MRSGKYYAPSVDGLVRTLFTLRRQSGLSARHFRALKWLTIPERPPCLRCRTRQRLVFKRGLLGEHRPLDLLRWVIGAARRARCARSAANVTSTWRRVANRARISA